MRAIISCHLVLQTSFYSKKQMKEYESMEAYNFFVSNWVHDPRYKRCSTMTLIWFSSG